MKYSELVIARRSKTSLVIWRNEIKVRDLFNLTAITLSALLLYLGRCAKACRNKTRITSFPRNQAFPLDSFRLTASWCQWTAVAGNVNFSRKSSSKHLEARERSLEWIKTLPLNLWQIRRKGKVQVYFHHSDTSLALPIVVSRLTKLKIYLPLWQRGEGAQKRCQLGSAMLTMSDVLLDPQLESKKQFKHRMKLFPFRAFRFVRSRFFLLRNLYDLIKKHMKVSTMMLMEAEGFISPAKMLFSDVQQQMNFY